MPLLIGTRGSRLALAQAARVCALLDREGIAAETVVITTPGDTITGVPLHEIGGQGVFVRALDDAILRGEIDCAVHSMKDIPARRPEGVTTCAILERDSPADFMVHLVPEDRIRVIGTSSTRRRAQLLRMNRSWEPAQLRGNVDTRLRKLEEGQYDAIVLAEAGLQRMGISVPGNRLPPDRFVPSPNQGTIAVVARDDPSVTGPLEILDHPPSRRDVNVERAVMEEVGGGCYTPQGIYCRDGLLIAEVLSLDGSRGVRMEERISDLKDARRVGRLLRDEAGDLIREAYRELGLKEDE
ncbi:hydroxymethylbilane synthase [Methanolinea mesophila]|uniref:hydroxymethylbilane synthase n=1 Tax=Methanolinea mesophila TaxID=547055 RepID=UPI001AE1BD2C|nr:hydroxymethylbilane synthase [Methanolinea mesophila]MBP1929612.1 hydroxymethylbilane synthase [Methanolinea mesophila]